MSKKKRVPPPKKSNNTLIYAGLAVVVIAVLAFILLNNTTPEPKGKLPTAGKFIKLNTPSTYEPGKVKIVEYMKFGCSHCYALSQKMPDFKNKYGDRLEVTYKPMLWRSIPADLPTRISIEAYILANRSGKGEEMKDAIFKAVFVDNNLNALSSESVLSAIAKKIGLGDDFAAALERGDAKNEAEDNINQAENYGVSYTPTLIINGNLKIDPSMVNQDNNLMDQNLDTVISSLLS
ncbi:Thioredoxin [uncultured archaeon]|nr:Thioredoxin [uncultured archaeon]